ncbi:hypothetical protein O9992_12835 [Vibrio lentus]|nr:hypothetical protein [Vibrio lentus]
MKLQRKDVTLIPDFSSHGHSTKAYLTVSVIRVLHTLIYQIIGGNVATMALALVIYRKRMLVRVSRYRPGFNLYFVLVSTIYWC